MKNAIIYFSLFVLLSLANNIFAYDLDYNKFKENSEPQGFNDLKWGQNIASIDDMILLGHHMHPENKVYKRKNEKLEIGGARVRSIAYYFWKGKFYLVVIDLEKGINNFNLLKEEYCDKFGNCKQLKLPKEYNIDEELIAYGWEGSITGAIVKLSKPLDIGGCDIWFIEIDKDAPH